MGPENGFSNAIPEQSLDARGKMHELEEGILKKRIELGLDTISISQPYDAGQAPGFAELLDQYGQFIEVAESLEYSGTEEERMALRRNLHQAIEEQGKLTAIVRHMEEDKEHAQVFRQATAELDSHDSTGKEEGELSLKDLLDEEGD